MSTACPKCQKPLVRRREIGGKAWHWCATCRQDWKEDYLLACSRSTDLQAVMYSMTHVVIKPRRGTSDGWIIQTLFEKADRQYIWMRGWVITNLDKYSHLKCIQVAIAGYSQQGSLLEIV